MNPRGRYFKVIRNGRTTSAGTHNLAEAAEALAEAWHLGDCFELRIQHGAEAERHLTEAEAAEVAGLAARTAVAV